MKQSLKSLLPLLFLLPYVLHAQKFIDGYVITNAGDTLQGQLKDLFPDKRATEVIFQPLGKTSSKKYTATDIKGFHINNEGPYDAVRLMIEGESQARHLFLRRIVEGKYIVRRLEYSFNIDVTPLENTPIPNEPAVIIDNNPPDDVVSLPYNRRGIWYFINIPEQESSILLSPQNFKEVLIGITGLCTPPINKGKYNYTDWGISQMIIDLAACHQFDVTPLVDTNKPKREVRLSVVAGVHSTQVTSGIKTFENVDFKRSIIPEIGFLIGFPMNKRLILQTGILGQVFSSTATVEHTVPEGFANVGEQMTLDHEMNFAFLIFPVDMKWYLMNTDQKTALYIKVGAQAGLGIGNNSSTEEAAYNINDNGDAEQLETAIDIPTGVSQITRYLVGFQTGVGVDFNLNEKLPLTLELGYAKGRSLNTNSNGIINQFEGLNLRVGVSF